VQPQVLYPNLNVEANIITAERPKVLTIQEIIWLMNSLSWTKMVKKDL
jgi:hypothetical protein